MHPFKDLMKVQYMRPVKVLTERSFQMLCPSPLYFCCKQVHQLEGIGQRWMHRKCTAVSLLPTLRVVFVTPEKVTVPSSPQKLGCFHTVTLVCSAMHHSSAKARRPFAKTSECAWTFNQSLTCSPLLELLCHHGGPLQHVPTQARYGSMKHT